MNGNLLSVCKKLEANRFSVFCMEDAKAAREQILRLIPKGSLVGVGDSVSLRQLGALEALQADGRVVIDLFSKEISELTSAGEISMKKRTEIARMALNCEFFITGTNAVTEDGVLVNIDGYANRVAGMMFGPKNAVIVVGRNKIVKDVDEALYRIRNVIAPEHARIKWKDTPCAATGRCNDCRSPERLCSVTTIMERAPGYITIYVILVDEDLGLGWDEDWPEERIERIRESYASYTWLKLGSLKPKR
jgi:hypothetical protein